MSFKVKELTPPLPGWGCSVTISSELSNCDLLSLILLTKSFLKTILSNYPNNFIWHTNSYSWRYKWVCINYSSMSLWNPQYSKFSVSFLFFVAQVLPKCCYMKIHHSGVSLISKAILISWRIKRYIIYKSSGDNGLFQGLYNGKIPEIYCLFQKVGPDFLPMPNLKIEWILLGEFWK